MIEDRTVGIMVVGEAIDDLVVVVVEGVRIQGRV